jgi:hypothetical protein
MAITLASITLPGDMQWIDEFDWSPVAQQVEITTGGSLLVEESAQLAGRPITLSAPLNGNVGFALPTRAVVAALQSLCNTPHSTSMLLTLDDGRTFNVRFDYSNGTPVEAAPIKHIVPQDDADLYTLTLRLMQV